MKPSLYASLVAAIESWMNDHCEDDDWVDGYVAPELAEDMARAAASVVDATVHIQEFMRREGHTDGA